MRSLSRDARHERRVQVIRLRKAGRTYDEIAAQTGLSRTGVFDVCKRHAAAGAKALQDAPSGRKAGEGRLLDATQEALVRKLITDKTPDQLKMPYALWTRAAVSQLIEQRFGIALPVRTMGLYLARWGFTPLPLEFFGLLALLTGAYLAAVQWAKRAFHRHRDLCHAAQADSQ